MTSALYLTADLTCRLKYRTLVVLLILIHFASLRYEQALPSQHARLLFTPSLHRGSTTGTLYCMASPTASCTVLRWYSGRRPELVCGIRWGDRRSMTAVLQQLHWLLVKYRIEYKLLVIVFRALHDRTPEYLASLITPYVPRPTICRSRPTHPSTPQPRALRPPFILSRWADSMERATGRPASDRVHGHI